MDRYNFLFVLQTNATTRFSFSHHVNCLNQFIKESDGDAYYLVFWVGEEMHFWWFFFIEFDDGLYVMVR